ncbi:Protein CBR-ARRD-3 [Caenorhabditis briggsae]|uniref:Arrestin C-terminal-like domain-containing protein n=2 Tax=Caenorhabditis briggsae TaxID=6238 RepID=A0AAE9DGP3_CAEBR|nr:Protein CBR-ARRD-3 [Caenorhabditis briggsae]ULU03623.1 hypothetical protein L3Y34_016838 [Caenorhabditis briggsae]UMM15628.1 hypothetical protein L5515_012995 [Caenorhabditis briggsae]CAP22248.1 Protein CBR-ARRD-3 [Caenorhabditis briggsae]
MEKLQIHLDNSSAAYFPGRNVTGKITFNIHKPLSFSIDARILGEAVTFWKHWNTTFREHIQFTSKNDHLDELTQLQKYESVAPGAHTLNFSFRIPQESPPSFEGKFGSIRYKIHVAVSRSEKKKMESEQTISVMPYLNLNSIPRGLLPLEHNKSIFYLSKEIEVNVKIHQRGFIAGERIPIEMTIINKTRIKTIPIFLMLIQVTHFEAQQKSGHIFKENLKFHRNPIEDNISEVKKDIKMNSTCENLNFELLIPVSTRSSFKTKLIQLAYKLLISVGNDKNVDFELPIIIGTVSVQPEPPSYKRAMERSEDCPPNYNK